MTVGGSGTFANGLGIYRNVSQLAGNGEISCFTVEKTVNGSYQGGNWSGFTTMDQGNYNALTNQYDQGIVWSDNAGEDGLNASSGFVIVPHYNGYGGIRILQGGCYAYNWWKLSDSRLKNSVKDLDINEFSIDTLRPVSYTTVETNVFDTGFIAHEMQETAFSYLVDGEQNGETIQSVNYISLISVLVKEVQELKLRVKELESNIKKDK